MTEIQNDPSEVYQLLSALGFRVKGTCCGEQLCGRPAEYVTLTWVRGGLK